MERFSSLSTPVQWLIGALGVGTLLGFGVALGTGKIVIIIFILALIVLLLLLLGGFLLFKSWQRKKQSSQFTGDISQHSTASPRNISDPGHRARLDDLRKKFGEGIEAYRSRGKDIYKLPWYVIVGEPGSGKTEAIRHCNIGFPPGMQDEFQGVGGTINMNWWFANNAVLLDTAGRLMFEEVKPGETSEWREFLTLLKKNRPNCPVNGLFLVIPSDSLVTDSIDVINKKAGKIAQQLDVIQRILDIRFPVFVVVTKCDKITGFKEFFDSISDPTLQHQMMGWSNPNPLDSPFQPEFVDQHLAKVQQNLRFRRLGLLRDPAPEFPGGRRVDEVDALYAFPHNLSYIGSRLRSYLQTIFVAGEWSSKPLFFRGIYFSSSMREGAALDQDLAQALGVGADELPEGKDWERERAYFLRDLFVEKAFKEKELVTRATNTGKMLRRRQILLFACGFLALAVFAGVAWLGMTELTSTVGNKSHIWKDAAQPGWTDGNWNQAIVTPAGQYQPMVEFKGEPRMSQGAFYSNLTWHVQHPLKDNWKFPGLAKVYNEQSTNAYHIVFETGVVKPIIDGVRSKMKAASTAVPSAIQSAALIGLIQLEGDAQTRAAHGPSAKAKLSADDARKFLAVNLSYLTGTNFGDVDSNLVSSMAWAYSNSPSPQDAWPPRWISETTNFNGRLESYPAILAGLDSFIANATNTIRSQVEIWNLTTNLIGALDRFKAGEDRLYTAAAGLDRAGANEAATALGALKDSLDKQTDDIAKSGLFKGTLIETYQNLRSKVQAEGAATFDSVKAANDKLLAEHRDMPLYADIASKLAEVQASLGQELAKLDTSADTNKLHELDQNYLAKNAQGRRLYGQRWDLYNRAMKVAPDSPLTPKWGKGDEDLQNFIKSGLGPVYEQVAAYSGPRANVATTIARFFLRSIESGQCFDFFSAYLKQAGAELNNDLGFPLTMRRTKVLTVDQVKTTAKKVTLMIRDLPRLSTLISSNNQFADQTEWPGQWKEYTNRIQGVKGVADCLFDDAGQTITCTISLAAGQPKDDGQRWRGKWRHILLEGEGNMAKKTIVATDQPLGDASVDQELRFKLTTDDPSDAPLPAATMAWGPIYLLQSNSQSSKKNGVWYVDLPVGNGNDSFTIPVMIKFSQISHELPSPGNWPKS
jgi:hypothetical protein